MSPGADHARGGPWSLSVARTLGPDHWLTFELDVHISRPGMKVYRSSIDWSVVLVTVTSDRPFESALKYFGLDSNVFGSPTLWPAPHRRKADGNEPQGESGWSWLHADAPPGFPFADGRRPTPVLIDQPEGLSAYDAEESPRRIFGCGILERATTGEPIAGVLDATLFEVRANESELENQVLIDLVGMEDKDGDVLAMTHEAEGSILLSLDFPDDLYRLRPLKPTDGTFLSTLGVEFPVAILENLILVTGMFENELETVHDLKVHEPIEALEILLGSSSDKVFAVHYILAIDHKVKAHYWLTENGWSDFAPTDEPKWVAEVADQVEAEMCELDDDDEADELDIWTNADCHFANPGHAPFLIERWQQGKALDRVMVEISEFDPEAVIRPEDLSGFGCACYYEEFDRNPYVLAEADPAMKDLARLGENYGVRADRFLDIYAYMYDSVPH
jgi:hypothetical protein